jgi:nifR3 family TIM-barrel protein
MSIYQQLLKPVFALSPMEGVTDAVFRKIVINSSRPGLVYTEFVNVDGFNSKGRKDIEKRLRPLENGVPIVVQLWGLKPENFKKTAEIIVREYPVFQGIDLNMGCSVRNVLNRGAGAGLIKKPSLVKDIIDATKDGCENLPVSVKTRIGYEKANTEEWIGFLLEQDLEVISVHGRTAKQGYSGNADWNEIGKVVDIRNFSKKHTYIFGNGDIKSMDEAKEKVAMYGVDGVLIGREAWNNPWVFSGKSINEVPFKVKKDTLLKHIELYIQVYGSENIFELRKFFKTYINGFNGASKVRQEMMKIEDGKELIEYVKNIKKTL